MSPIRALALDSAFGGLSAAAAEGDIIVAALTGAPGAKAAESLPGLTARVLDAAAWRYADIDRIAVTLGPGGFTSLRAGLAFAKGLAMGSGRPLLGFTTLEALAVSLPSGSTPVAAVIDAKRDEVFLQVFAADLSPMTEASVVPIAALEAAFPWPSELRVCGSGAHFLTQMIGVAVLDTGVVSPDAAALARYCQAFEPAMRPAHAVYLRAADARPMT